MPINKNALVRYQTLDACLSNTTRRYYIEDLIDACCQELTRVNGDSGTKGSEGVSRRQVLNDLDDMEMIYEVMIDRIPDGHRKYFRYAQDSKTLRNSKLSQDEIDLINNALLISKRFEGVPHLDWINDIDNKLFTTSKLGENTTAVVSFQHNPYLAGLNRWYKPVFNAIVNKSVIELKYHPFEREVQTILVSPYHLKQYNNRWFLIGKALGCEYFSNFAIDRIDDIALSNKPYEPLDDDFSFVDYFADVVGVSVNGTDVHEVILHVSPRDYNYIITKPLHESQTTVSTPLENGRYVVKLKVQINYELKSLLRSFGTGIEVIAPHELREDMKNSIAELAKLYE